MDQRTTDASRDRPSVTERIAARRARMAEATWQHTATSEFFEKLERMDEVGSPWGWTYDKD